MFEQMLNICVKVKYLLGFVKSLMCRVIVLEGPECRQHHAHSVIIVDTMHCIRRGLGMHSILE